MSELAPEEFDYTDYDLEELVTPVETSEALPYPDAAVQDAYAAHGVNAFVSIERVTPAQAIATARSWSLARKFMTVGFCLGTVRQYYQTPAGVATAADSWAMSAHKRQVSSGSQVPRGVPVYWTGGSTGAGHIAISIGGGFCYSTDWKEPGRIDVARIDDITSHWGLQFRGYTFEVNGVQVWAPSTTIGTVSLKNVQPKMRNADVLKVKKRLSAKGYKGFITSSSYFGAGTKRAYSKYQEHLGYVGPDANGLPGRKSLRKLGFTVNP